MKYALVNVNLLDGTKDMQAKPNTTVLVEDGKFTKIIEGSPVAQAGSPVAQTGSQATQDGAEGNAGANNAAVPSGYEIIDLAGASLMPGLINMHVHMVVDGTAPKSDKPKDFRKTVQALQNYSIVKWYMLRGEAKHAKNELLSGVTTLRAVGGIKDWDGIARDRVNAATEAAMRTAATSSAATGVSGARDAQPAGPRILSANMAISVPGGHFAGSLATEATSAEEAAQNARDIIATKPDLLKLMITGGVMDATEEGEPGALRMPAEYVKAACDVAHEAGLKVAAHVESTEGVRVALQNGVDTIEHGAAPDDEIIALFKQTGAADICTISPAVPYALMPMETAKCGETGRKNGRIVMDGIIECARRCLAEGIPVGLGTDTGCPFITHYNMWRELVYFAHYCNVSNAFALHTATLVNAQILGMDKQIGSIEEGKLADFIVCEENPLENLEALRHLKMVAREGAIIRDPKPTPTPGVDAALDAITLD